MIVFIHSVSLFFGLTLLWGTNISSYSLNSYASDTQNVCRFNTTVQMANAYWTYSYHFILNISKDMTLIVCFYNGCCNEYYIILSFYCSIFCYWYNTCSVRLNKFQCLLLLCYYYYYITRSCSPSCCIQFSSSSMRRKFLFSSTSCILQKNNNI